MRELRFRVWNKTMHQYRHFALQKGVSVSIGADLEIEQYTGLKDKNGKEIYEGDILKFRGRAYEVKFDNYGQFCMENKNYHWLENGYSFRSVDIWCAEGILVEVIGNIHENPELIKEQE